MRLLSDLLWRYLFAVIAIAIYVTLIFISGVDAVIPRIAMTTFHTGSVMLFVLVVYVPVCWLMFSVISIWYKPVWLELGLSLLIPLMAYVVLPAMHEHFFPSASNSDVWGTDNMDEHFFPSASNSDVWGTDNMDEYVQKYADRRELIRFIDYLGSTVTVVFTAFFMQIFRYKKGRTV